jgi:hypothetical protein
MILMRMCQSHYIDSLESPRPQIWRYRLLARIDSSTLLLTGESAKRSAPINQQSLARRRNHEQGIALPDIQHCNFKFPACDSRRKWIHSNDQTRRSQYTLQTPYHRLATRESDAQTRYDARQRE